MNLESWVYLYTRTSGRIQISSCKNYLLLVGNYEMLKPQHRNNCVLVSPFVLLNCK